MRLPLPLLVLCVSLVAVSPAAAHSVVERSSPAANSALDVAPREVILWFNEPVDPAFSTAIVTDPAGRRVSERAVVAADGRRMTVPLQPIERGFYTVRWRILSAVDGHTTGGVFGFTVGLGTRPPESFGGTAAPDRALALIRWIGFAAALLLAGALWFPALVQDAGLRRLTSDEGVGPDRTSSRHLRRVTIVAAATALGAAVVEILYRTAMLSETSLVEALAGGLLGTMVWTTKPGWSALVRIGMAALALLPNSPRGHLLRTGGLVWAVLVAGVLALLGGPSALSGSGHLVLVMLVASVYGLTVIVMAIVLPQVADFRMPDLAATPVLLGALMLAGLTINSHAWGRGAFATLVDWAHLGAGAAWIGGLAVLTLLVASARGEARAVLARALLPAFSRVAALSLVVLVATGLYSTWLHVPGLGALTTTGYGRILLGKLVLILPLVWLGALNRFVLLPRLTDRTGVGGSASRATPRALSSVGPASSRWLLAALGGEVGLGLAVVLVVALLTATPPARVTLAPSSSAAAALRYLGVAPDARLTLTVSPAQPGPNQIEVIATQPDGRPLVAEDSRVLLRLTKLDEDLAPTTIRLDAQGEGRYTTADRVTIPAGWWEVEVVLRRRGRLDAVTSFPLRIGQAPAAAVDPIAARLLGHAVAAMSSLRTWREIEQITDGAGGVVVVHVDLVRPDRMRILTSAGTEAVVIGSTRWVRDPTGWRQETLARPIAADGALQYLRGAEAIIMGRPASCEGEPCRVILWEAPGRAAAFAGWIGTDSRRLHKILMVAPQHFMTGSLSAFDAPLRVEAPR